MIIGLYVMWLTSNHRQGVKHPFQPKKSESLNRHLEGKRTL